MKRYYLSLLLAFLLLSDIAAALEFDQVRISDSNVSFTYRQMGVPMEGMFSRFSAQVKFDPARLAKAQARIDIELGSIDTGSDEANAEAEKKPWFNTSDFPRANFTSKSVRHLGGDRYEAIGQLTIKGQSRDIAAPFTFHPSATQATFDGIFNIKRLDYGIGNGEWSDESIVANDIAIKFHLVVSASPVKRK